MIAPDCHCLVYRQTLVHLHVYCLLFWCCRSRGLGFQHHLQRRPDWCVRPHICEEHPPAWSRHPGRPSEGRRPASRWEPGRCREWRVTSHGLHFLFLFTASWTFSFSHAFLILETQHTSYVSYRGSNDSLFSGGFPFLVPCCLGLGKMSIVFLSPLREALSFLVWESKWC